MVSYYLMRTTSFFQICLGFLLLMGTIALFHLLGIKIDFITMLLLTIFTIAISIFFYNESNKMTKDISDLIRDLKTDVSILKDRGDGIVKHIKTSKSSINQDKIRRIYGRWVKT